MESPFAVTETTIIDYYEQCQVDYEIIWHLNTHGCMHYGYWDATTPNLRSALLNMNTKVAEMAGIQTSDKVLDAGCGVGGSSVFLASRFGCQVEGITLSPKQVAHARQKAMALGVSEAVTFSVANYTNMPFPDCSFDVVWAIESVCHAVEKKDFLKEAYRVLKKGGRLIVADFFSNYPEADVTKSQLLHKWAHSWAVPSFEPLVRFTQKAVDSGFSNTRSVDITAHIAPSARRLYYCFVPGIICDGALRIIGKRTALHKANVWSTYYQYKSLKAGLWSYHMLIANK
ncbi:methyltransferase domain-containing protein [Nibrella viscosa]|uniref:Methyltransferase domain-containing protein n=1 Tax=Nibrella viscosa TaxID=1084524 RepID=A0ABP8KUY2_9BACT